MSGCGLRRKSALLGSQDGGGADGRLLQYGGKGTRLAERTASGGVERGGAPHAEA